MKSKVLATLILTSLLATPLAFADTDPSSGAVSGTDAINSSGSGVSGTGAIMNGSGSSLQNNGSDNGSMDQGINDTATGDDDY